MKENERGPLGRPKWGQHPRKSKDFGFTEEEGTTRRAPPRRGQNPREGGRFLALPGVEKDPPDDPRAALSRPRGRG
eukprot:52134-Pyramimonas_sp.AAC.1